MLVGRRLLVLALLSTNLFALDPLYYVPFPSCLTIRGIVKEVDGATATVTINKGARSEADIKLLFGDWPEVLLLPTTAVEIKGVQALKRGRFVARKGQLKILNESFNPALDAITRENICDLNSKRLFF